MQSSRCAGTGRHAASVRRPLRRSIHLAFAPPSRFDRLTLPVAQRAAGFIRAVFTAVTRYSTPAPLSNGLKSSSSARLKGNVRLFVLWGMAAGSLAGVVLALSVSRASSAARPVCPVNDGSANSASTVLGLAAVASTVPPDTMIDAAAATCAEVTAVVVG